jgi:KDO2-lipid IV(A) lauroyltransferase
MTQALADAFASGIADHPEDWHMLQRLWLADLEPRRAQDQQGQREQPDEGGTAPPGQDRSAPAGGEPS